MIWIAQAVCHLASVGGFAFLWLHECYWGALLSMGLALTFSSDKEKNKATT